MTRNVLITALLLTFSLQLFAQREEAAILKVITLETAAFNSKNYEQWKSCWHTEGEILFNYITKQNMYLFNSWDDLDNAMASSFEGDINETLEAAQKTHVRMTIGENVAWVNYNQDDNGRITKEQRVLEKIHGEWKIVNMTAVHVTSFGVELAGNDD